MDFEDSDSVGGNTGHIATAFLMTSEVPTDEESEFIVTVQKDACNNKDVGAYCSVIDYDALDEVQNWAATI